MRRLTVPILNLAVVVLVLAASLTAQEPPQDKPQGSTPGAASQADAPTEKADKDKTDDSGQDDSQDAAMPMPSLSGSLEADFVTRYIYRGFAWSRGLVMEPYASITKGSFTVGGWGNMPLDHEPQQGTIGESDFTLGWSHDFGSWRIEPTVEYWLDRPVHDGTVAGDGELSIKISHAVKGPVRIFTNHAFDVFQFRGSYYGEIGPNIDGSWKGLDLELNGHLAWASAEFNFVNAGVAKTALNLAAVDGSATKKLGSHGFYVRAHFELSRLLDAAVRRSSGNGTLAVAGIAIGFEWEREAKDAKDGDAATQDDCK